MKIDEVSWVGIKIKGTNVIVSIEKAVPKPEIIDESTPCDIVSDKDAIITKITARNGTAVAKIGDEVKAGDILIKGIMEGKYTQERYVHADGEILAKVSYKIEEEAELKQCYYEPTEKAYNNFRIKFNNFEINFNKRLPNFKNYDTIETNKKLKLFSNFYIPVEFKKVTYKEKKIKTKEYTTEELSEELQEKLKSKLLDQNNLSEKDVIEMVPVITPTETGIKLNLTCITEEKIGVQVTY